MSGPGPITRASGTASAPTAVSNKRSKNSGNRGGKKIPAPKGPTQAQSSLHDKTVSKKDEPSRLTRFLIETLGSDTLEKLNTVDDKHLCGKLIDNLQQAEDKPTISELQMQIATLEKQQEETIGAYSKTDIELREATKTISNLREQIDGLKKSKGELENKQNILNRATDEAASEIAELEGFIAEHEKTEKELKNRTNSQSEKITVLEKDLEQATAAKQELENEKIQLIEKQQELEINLKTLSKKLEVIKSSLKIASESLYDKVDEKTNTESTTQRFFANIEQACKELEIQLATPIAKTDATTKDTTQAEEPASTKISKLLEEVFIVHGNSETEIKKLTESQTVKWNSVDKLVTYLSTIKKILESAKSLKQKALNELLTVQGQYLQVGEFNIPDGYLRPLEAAARQKGSHQYRTELMSKDLSELQTKQTERVRKIEDIHSDISSIQAKLFKTVNAINEALDPEKIKMINERHPTLSETINTAYELLREIQIPSNILCVDSLVKEGVVRSINAFLVDWSACRAIVRTLRKRGSHTIESLKSQLLEEKHKYRALLKTYYQSKEHLEGSLTVMEKEVQEAQSGVVAVDNTYDANYGLIMAEIFKAELSAQLGNKAPKKERLALVREKQSTFNQKCKEDLNRITKAKNAYSQLLKMMGEYEQEIHRLYDAIRRGGTFTTETYFNVSGWSDPEIKKIQNEAMQKAGE